MFVYCDSKVEPRSGWVITAFFANEKREIIDMVVERRGKGEGPLKIARFDLLDAVRDWRNDTHSATYPAKCFNTLFPDSKVIVYLR